jgi:prepilin peptidase CpaA
MPLTQDQLHVLLIVFVLTVAIIDWRTHRIPNVLCAVAAMFGVGLQIGLHGEAGLFSALGGAAVGFAMFLPFYVLRAFGAGDVKAMATVGTFLGFPATVLAVGSTLIVGALLGALVLLLRPAHAGATLHRLLGLLVSPATAMRNARADRSASSSDRFPYGIAIACGTAVALFVFSH